MTPKDKTYQPCSFTEQQLAEALESEAERQLGIELGGGGWAALLGEDVDDDWDGESESAKRALPRLAPPVHFDPLPPSHSTVAAVSRSKLAERDADSEYIGFHRYFDLERYGSVVRAWCEEHFTYHSAASEGELIEALDGMHAPPEPDPDEYHERKRDLR